MALVKITVKILGVIINILTVVAFIWVASVHLAQGHTPNLNSQPTVDSDAESDAESDFNHANKQVGIQQVECLRANIYWEARNQSDQGQLAVAWVTLNRVDSDEFPNSICAVVKQAHRDARGNPIRHRCAFSWYCDGASDQPSNNVLEQRAWRHALHIANQAIASWLDEQDSPVGHATHYHADWIDAPAWAAHYDRVDQIDQHVFYQ